MSHLKIDLPNGLRIITEEMPHTHSVSMGIFTQVGSRYAMAKGAKIIKPLLVVVSIALAIRLLADPGYPLRIWLGL